MGNLVRYETRNEEVLVQKYEYDTSGQLTSHTYASRKKVFHDYDRTGYFSGKPSAISMQLFMEGDHFPKMIDYEIGYDEAERVREAQCHADGVPYPDWSMNCTYDENGNITRDKEKEYSYNQNGDIVSAPTIKQIEYHPYHRMPHTIETDTEKISLRYGADRKRLMKTTDKERRLYLNNGGGRVLEEFTERCNTEYVYGPLGLCAVFNNSKLNSPVLDRLGSVWALLSPEGEATGFHYSPYGRMISSKAPDMDIMRHYFTGYEFDPETGLYNAGARLYDPKIGRYYSVDSKLSDSSPYLYARDDPFSFVDPTGESSWWGMLIGVIVSVAAFIVTAGTATVAIVPASLAAGSAIGSFAGAASSLVGTVVTCAIDQQPITARTLLTAFSSGVVSGAAGNLVGSLVQGEPLTNGQTWAN